MSPAGPRADLVSIVIPTCERPAMLAHCVRAALAQSYAPIEVVVGDDSPSDESERFLADHGLLAAVRYARNERPLGQSANVDQLFTLARGGRIVLVHDDDWLLPGGVSALIEAWQRAPDTIVAYGRQQVADADGSVLDAQSESLNAEYSRTPDQYGRQPDPRQAALLGQLPNNGYLVATDAARAVGYRHAGSVEHVVDFEFGLRLAQLSGSWVLDGSYVSVVRLSRDSIARGHGGAYHNDADESFELVARYVLPAELEPVREARLRRYALAAVEKWLVDGRRVRAARVIVSPRYLRAEGSPRRKLAMVALLLLPTRVVRRLVTDRRAPGTTSAAGPG